MWTQRRSSYLIILDLSEHEIKRLILIFHPTWLQLLLTDKVVGLVSRVAELIYKGLEVRAVVVEVELDMHPLEDDVRQVDPGERRGEVRS